METREVQRWAAVAAGALLVTAGIRQRGRSGWLLTLAGGALAGASLIGRVQKIAHKSVFDARPSKQWQPSHERLSEDAAAFGRAAGSGIDVVEEASEESFPASDAPSFTPTTSLGKHQR